MKKHRFILALLLAPVALVESSCTTPPSERTTAVRTLEYTGQLAKSTVDTAAGLLKAGKITVALWQAIADIYDLKFQPLYAPAVLAVQGDLSNLATPDIIAALDQLLQAVAVFTK